MEYVLDMDGGGSSGNGAKASAASGLKPISGSNDSRRSLSFDLPPHVRYGHTSTRILHTIFQPPLILPL